MTIEQDIAELRKEGADLNEAVKGAVAKMSEPVYNLRSGEETVSYWGEPSRAKTLVSRGEGRRALPMTLPKGYEGGAKVFKSFGGFLQDGYRNSRQADWQGKHASVYKAIQGMSEQVATDGGYLVMPEFSETILEKVYDNDLYSGLDHYTVSGNNMSFPRNAETSRANGSRHGGLRGYWTGEGNAITKSHPTIKQVTLQLKKLAIIVYLTQELIDDAGQSLEQYVTKKAADEFNFMIGDAIINGIGGGQPLGILNAGCLVSVAKETGQLADTIVSENIDKMYGRAYAPGNYRWYTNQDTHSQLAGLFRGIGTGGELMFNPPGGLSSAPYATLKGKQLVNTEFNATLGDQGDIIMADLKEIIAISKGGITQASSMHVEFLTDQMALRFVQRVDFRPWEDTPLTPYKGTNTQSSFVTLDARG